MINKGRSASGNETISRGVINSALKHKKIQHMYIMWSGTDRYEVITKEEGPDDRGEISCMGQRFQLECVLWRTSRQGQK